MLKGRSTSQRHLLCRLHFNRYQASLAALVACHGDSNFACKALVAAIQIWSLCSCYSPGEFFHVLSCWATKHSRCSEPSLPSGALPTPKGTCITSTNPLVQVRPAGRGERERCLASMLPVTHTVGEYNGENRHTHYQLWEKQMYCSVSSSFEDLAHGPVNLMLHKRKSFLGHNMSHVSDTCIIFTIKLHHTSNLWYNMS